MTDRVALLVQWAMDNAAANGYAQELSVLSDDELVLDLQTCDADLEREAPADVLAAVKKFRAAQVA